MATPASSHGVGRRVRLAATATNGSANNATSSAWNWKNTKNLPLVVPASARAGAGSGRPRVRRARAATGAAPGAGPTAPPSTASTTRGSDAPLPSSASTIAAPPTPTGPQHVDDAGIAMAALPAPAAASSSTPASSQTIASIAPRIHARAPGPWPGTPHADATSARPACQQRHRHAPSRARAATACRRQRRDERDRAASRARRRDRPAGRRSRRAPRPATAAPAGSASEWVKVSANAAHSARIHSRRRAAADGHGAA